MLLADTEKVLVNAQEGKTKALRQWRFTSKKEIKVRAIKAYVKEAIELEKAGKRIGPDRAKALTVPPCRAASRWKKPWPAVCTSTTTARYIPGTG